MSKIIYFVLKDLISFCTRKSPSKATIYTKMYPANCSCHISKSDTVWFQKCSSSIHWRCKKMSDV